MVIRSWGEGWGEEYGGGGGKMGTEGRWEGCKVRYGPEQGRVSDMERVGLNYSDPPAHVCEWWRFALWWCIWLQSAQ